MIDAVFTAGLGDRIDYLKKATRHWPERHGIQPHFSTVGWHDPIETYEKKFNAAGRKLGRFDSKVALVGVSAGGVIDMNLLRRYPELISSVTTICSPTKILPDDEDSRRLNESPLLRHNIHELELDGTVPELVQTWRAGYETVVNPKTVPVEGADNQVIRLIGRLPMIGHVSSIWVALHHHDEEIAAFIHQHAKQGAS